MKVPKRQEIYKPLKATKFEIIQGIRESFASHDFSDEDLLELVDPKLGVITSFNDLMSQLENLRKIDLGQTPPALGIEEVSD